MQLETEKEALTKEPFFFSQREESQEDFSFYGEGGKKRLPPLCGGQKRGIFSFFPSYLSCGGLETRMPRVAAVEPLFPLFHRGMT